jgi:hypothetical protein
MKSSLKKIYSASRHSFTARGVSITSESGCCVARHSQRNVTVNSAVQRVAHQPRTDSSGFYAYSCRTIRPVHQSSPDPRERVLSGMCGSRAGFFIRSRTNAGRLYIGPTNYLGLRNPRARRTLLRDTNRSPAQRESASIVGRQMFCIDAIDRHAKNFAMTRTCIATCNPARHV